MGMTLLIKDHKTWSLIPKTRAVMGGNEGANYGISEFLSLVLEPVAKEQDGKMEISATNDLLADIADLNDELDEEEKSEKISIHKGEISIHQEGTQNLQDVSSSHEEAMPDQESDHLEPDQDETS